MMEKKSIFIYSYSQQVQKYQIMQSKNTSQSKRYAAPPKPLYLTPKASSQSENFFKRMKEEEANKSKQQSQILTQDQDQEEKGQYMNLQKKKKKEEIIKDYKRIRSHKTLLQRIIEGQILANFLKLYRIIPQQIRIINQQNAEHHDQAGIKELENICTADNLQLIQISAIQELIVKQKRMSSDIKRYLQSMEKISLKIKELEYSDKITNNSNQLESMYDQIKTFWMLIKKNLNIIDVSLFVRLIELNQQSNNLIKGKNIALLIGPSGSGKTTIMLRTLGYQLVNSTDHHTGLKTLLPIKKIKPQHIGLISRPGAQSVTQTIFAAEIDVPEFQNFYICDTPGLFDSQGPVVDLVNGISLINSIQNAKSVKPIIVISANMVGERLEGIKKLGKIVSNLLRKLDKNEQGLSIVFIFNKFSNDQQFLRLEAGVKNILQNLSQSDKINSKYVKFLQILHQTLFRANKKKYILFKPFNFDMGSTVNILKENLIQNPGEIFQYSHSVQSIQTVQLFMKKKIQLVNNYLDYNPQHSYFHLQQLKVLINHLKNAEYKNYYKMIKENIQQRSLEYFTRFKDLLSKETWENHISDEQIRESKEMYDKLSSLLIFEKEGQCSLYSNKDIDPIIESVTTIIEDVITKAQKMEDLKIDDKNIIKRMSLFCKLYNLQSISDNFKNNIFKQYETISSAMDAFLKNNRFAEYKEALQKYSRMQVVVKLFDNDRQKIDKNLHELLRQKYRKIDDNLKSSLSQANQKLQRLQLLIFPEQINKNLILIEQIQQISQKQFLSYKEKRQQLVQNIKSTIIRLQSDFRVELKSKKHQENSNLQAILDKLEVISHFQKLSRFVQAIITNIKEIIQTQIDDCMKKLKQMFEKLEHGQISSSFSHINTIIYALSYFPKLLSTDSKQKEVHNYFQQIQQDLINNFKKIIYKTRIINTSLKSLLKNDNLTQICCRLRELKYVQNANSSKTQTVFLDELKEQMIKFIDLCKLKREIPLKQLKKILQNELQQLDIGSNIQKVCQDIKKVNQYLQKLGELSINKVKPELLELLESIAELKRKYFQKIQNDYESGFVKIQSKYLWQLSIEQEVSCLKRMSNLFYLQQSERNQAPIHLKSAFSFQNIYQKHVALISKSIKFYSNNQDRSSSKQKIQKGLRLKKYEQYMDFQDKIQLDTLIQRYQTNESEANEIKLSYVFSEKYLDYQKLQSLYQKNIDNIKIVVEIQSKLQVYDKNICSQLNQIIQKNTQVEDIQNHQKQLVLLENAICFISKEEYFNNIFKQEILFKTDKDQIKKTLQIYKQQFTCIFQKIISCILKIDFNQEEIAKKIYNFQKLQRLLQSIFADDKDWKESIIINPMVQNLKNVPILELFPRHKYLKSLSAQIQARKSKDITQLIDPKLPSSIKFYPSLNPQHKQQYLRPLIQEFNQLKQQLTRQGRNQHSDSLQKQLKQLIGLLPSQLQDRYEDELNLIFTQRRNSLEQLNRKVSVGVSDNQIAHVFGAMKGREQYVNQHHIRAASNMVAQQYQKANQNDRDRSNIEQLLSQIETQHQSLVGKPQCIPIKQAFSSGKNMMASKDMQKADRILKQIRWKAPLMISSAKQREQLQKKYVQLIMANRSIEKYKQFIQDNTLYEHFNRVNAVFKQLVYQYQSQFPQDFDKEGKQQLTKLMKSKLFLKNIIINLRDCLDKNRTNSENYKILQLSTQNDEFDRFVKKIKQYQSKNYQFYQSTIIEFKKTKNQINLREKLLKIKHSFLFLINIEEIQEKLQEQDELQQYSGIIRRSCIKQLRMRMGQLIHEAQSQLRNYKSEINDHDLQMTTLFYYFFALWDKQSHKKFGFIKQSSLQFRKGITMKLTSLIDQAYACFNSKQIKSIDDYRKRSQIANIASPTSRILNILAFFEKLKQKIGRFQKTIAQKMEAVLSQLPGLSANAKVCLNQELLRRQNQPYISTLCANYKEFRHIKQIQFSKKTQAEMQQYLQKFLSSNNADRKFYKQSLHTIFRQFQKLISIHRQNSSGEIKQNLAKQIRQFVGTFPVQRILGKLFALYSIIKKENSCSTTYFQPHVSQVIATLTLLKIDEDKLIVHNKLVEIHTGEGKSIILGITESYLALRGFEVYHSCYSPILIHRDQMEFKQLQKQLGIEGQIFYGSFEETCEKILPQKFKELAIQQIQKNTFTIWIQWFSQKIQSIKDFFKQNLQKLSLKNKVLLLDEVDVLLSPDYYNKIYTPTVDITDYFLENRNLTKSKQDLITNFFIQIYEKIEKQRYFCLTKIDQFVHARKIVEIFPRIKEILLEIMKQIIISAKNPNKIKQISNNLSFKDKFKAQNCHSYQQLMAGVLIQKRGDINYDELKKSLKIRLKLCELSYSELPKYFSSIIGASGTLKTFGQRKKNQIIAQYQMSSLYFLPTIYQEKKHKMQRVCFEKSKSKYLQILTRTISNHFDKGGNRAILIIFKDQKQLKQLKQGVSFKRISQKYKENQLLFNKDTFNYAQISNNIIKATQPNTITLATKQFARGIDFKDETGLQQGLFVIIAYLPDSEEEYLQAKGRTARAGKNGKVFLCANEDVQVDSQDEESGLRKLFIKKEQAKMDEIKDSIRSVRLRHKNTLEVYTNQKDSIVGYLEQINKCNFRTIRIIVGIEIALHDREQILKQFVNTMKKYEMAFSQSKNFKTQVRVFAYGNYIDLKRQIKYFDKDNCSIENKSSQLRLDQIPQFTKNIKKIEQNKTVAKGESLELFLKYIKDRSKEADKIDQVYLFCSKQNLSWTKFQQTKQYKLLEDNKGFIDRYYNLKSCIEYIKRVEHTTSLNIFCFNKQDQNVKKFYQDLRNQTNCIKQLQFISKDEFKQNVDLYCARSFGEIIRNIANKK